MVESRFGEHLDWLAFLMAITTKLKSTAFPPHLRPYNHFRDSSVVADLIEESFLSTLDPDGRRYLRQMKVGSRGGGIARWTDYIFRSGFQPLSGFVWEEDGDVVGNLSLVPFYYRGKRINMIANVAVSPQYRRRGIARALTAAALERSQRGGVNATWLQVREDNVAALNLYQDMGFISKASRTTWIAHPDSLIGEPTSNARVSIRKRSHWHQQRDWLEQNYPKKLRWYFLLSMTAMSPGFISSAYQFINEMEIQHWSVVRDNTLLGVMSWQRSNRYADYLWLASSIEFEDQVLETVLPMIRRLRWMDRTLALDYPQNRAGNGLTTAGFEQKVTLNWMEVIHNRR